MPPIVASAPGRCGIVGNPSDIYGGFVVSCSVPLRNTCRLWRADEPVIGMGAEDPRLWEAATRRYPVEGWRYEWTSEIPRSSGLSGSTALLAATLLAILEARGEPPNLESVPYRTAFADLVRDVELNEAGIVCGYQDATMIVHGGLQAMDFAGKHPIEGGPPAKVEPIEAQLPFLLVTTGVERLSGSVHGPMRDRWLHGDPEVVAAMEHIAECGRIGAQALRAGNWAELARAMRENHRRIANLGGSGEAIDRLIEDCQDSGAEAAKLAGAGLGGTVIALTTDPASLEAELRRRGYVRFVRPMPVSGVGLEASFPGNP